MKLKASMFIAYFLLLIGALIVSLVLIYLILWGGLGIILTLTFYDARANVEYLTGLISAASSFYGNFSFQYAFPPGISCELEIKEDKVNMTVPSGTYLIGSSEIIFKKKTELKLPITKPKDLKVEDFYEKCDPNFQKILIAVKEGDEMRFGV